jgi:hypothetical protein
VRIANQLDRSIPLLVDPEQLRQVVISMIAHAVKFSADTSCQVSAAG